MFIQFIWVHALLIRRCSDIETNLGPKPNPCHSFSIWNLNSLIAHNYLKVSLLGNLMLYVYQKPISIHLTFLMMTILIFPAIT